MARKKAEPIPQEEPEMMEPSPPESDGTAERDAGVEGFPTDPEAMPFPDEPFSFDGSTFPPPEFAPPEASDPGVPDEAEASGENAAEAAEGYGELLSELSTALPEGGDVPEAEPLMLHETESKTTAPGASGESEEELSAADRMLLDEENGGAVPDNEPPAPPPASPSFSGQRRSDRVLTINARDEVETDAEREATLWHEIQNSFRTRRILTGTLDTVEQMESGGTLAVVNYNGFRVAIPAKEMLVNLPPMTGNSRTAYAERMVLMTRRLYTRLGSEIDFIVKGIENRTRSIVASRKDAMYRKRQTFYMDLDVTGQPMIYEGRIVQARVVAVAERVIRVEVFGVECNIRGGGISRAWYGNANENFSVGDTILVRVLTVDRPDIENIQITADIRSVTDEDSANVNKCVPQGHYVGRITDIRSGVFFIRLNNGVNAVAHSSYDFRSPGKKDDVSFVCTRIDPEHNAVVGIITRIIRQNL